MIRKLTNYLKLLVVGLLILMLLPALVAQILATIHPAVVLFLLLLASITAYLVIERRRPRQHQQRGTGGAERTPILPHGDGQ